jgi:hypothetical protein
MHMRAIHAAALAAALAIPAPAQTVARAPTPSEAAVLKADNDRFAAMQKADVAALERLLGAELRYTHTSAVVQSKDEFITDIRTGTLKYVSIEPKDQKIQVYGNVAVVTGGAAVHVILRGNDQSFQIRYTNVHVNRNGKWQMVAWEATRVP